MSFDTLAFAKRLAAAGMDSRQAQAVAEALNDIVFDTLATKSDLRELEGAMKAGFMAVEARFKEVDGGFKSVESRFKEMHLAATATEERLMNRLTIRTGAMIAGSTTLIVAILGTLNTLS